MKHALLADLGGTNLRMARAPLSALANPSAESLVDVRHFQNPTADDADPYAYLSACAAEFEPVELALLAVAGPVVGGAAFMPARNWRVTEAELALALSCQQVRLSNDFPAQAMAAPYLEASDLEPIRGQWPSLQTLAGSLLVTGPGTGLGVSVLHPLPRRPGHFFAQATESGHSHFTALTEFDWQLQQMVAGKWGRCSWERLICGPGLQQLYLAWHQLHGLQANPLTAQQIQQAANQGQAAAKAVIDYFFVLFGRFVGDMALAHGVSAVLLCGGVIGHLRPHFNPALFFDAMDDKGRFRDWVAELPVAINHSRSPGLLGAMALAREAFL